MNDISPDAFARAREFEEEWRKICIGRGLIEELAPPFPRDEFEARLWLTTVQMTIEAEKHTCRRRSSDDFEYDLLSAQPLNPERWQSRRPDPHRWWEFLKLLLQHEKVSMLEERMMVQILGAAVLGRTDLETVQVIETDWCEFLRRWFPPIYYNFNRWAGDDEGALAVFAGTVAATKPKGYLNNYPEWKRELRMDEDTDDPDELLRRYLVKAAGSLPHSELYHNPYRGMDEVRIGPPRLILDEECVKKWWNMANRLGERLGLSRREKRESEIQGILPDDGDKHIPYLDTLPDPADPISEFEAREAARVLMAKARAAMSPQQFQVLEMFRRGLTESQIAKQIGRTIGHVAKQHDRAKRKLKKLKDDPEVRAMYL